jgi:hypothetical protein
MQQVAPALGSYLVLLARAGRRDEVPSVVDEYVAAARELTYSVADFALALVLTKREQEFARLAPSLRASRWGQAAEALVSHEWSRAAAMFEEFGMTLYAREARALEQAEAGAA